MDIGVVKVTGREKVGLMPADSDAEETIGRMGDGEYALCKLKRVRSPKWHRMYMGICRVIGKNQDPQRSQPCIDYFVRIMAGHYETVIAAGRQEKVPKRIAFDELTADEWEEIWPSLELAIRENFGEEYLKDVA